MNLHARGITKHFGGAPVLQDVDFAAASGKVHAIVGENGAGKSTLVKILVTLIHQEPLSFPDLQPGAGGGPAVTLDAAARAGREPAT